MSEFKANGEVSASRRDLLKVSGVAAVGLASLVGVHLVDAPAAGAAQTPPPGDNSSRLATTSYVDGAVATQLASARVFNVINFGADPKGVVDSSNAVANAQAALKSAGGGELLFPPGGVYRFRTGLITRTMLADAAMSINASGSTLAPFGSGVGIDTVMSDPAYWAQSITPPMAPVVFSIMDCSALTSGAVGVRHSIAVGAYYDGLIHHAAAIPDLTWPTAGKPGARGWQIRNTVDSNSVARWTEQTVFGANSGVHNCYIGMEFDTADGTNSFGYTRMLRFVIECNHVRQRGVVIRASSSTAAQLYGSQLTWQGNSGNPSSAYVGTLTSSISAGTWSKSLGFASGTTVAAYDGEILIIKDSAGLNPQAVMVRGHNPIGSTSISTYQFIAASTFSAGTVEAVPSACVVGWPSPSAPGWSGATATDPSNLRRGSLNWNMESGGSTLAVATCPLFVSPGATFAVFGNVDLVTYASGLVQNYGTLQVHGAFEGHVSSYAEITSTYLGASIPGTPSVCLGQSVPRVQINDNTSLQLNSGLALLVAIPAQVGVPITYLGWYVGASGAASVSNHWLALLDNSFSLVATTNDLGPSVVAKTAYGAPIAHTAAGASSSYTPSYTGVMYIAICVVAASMPTVTGTKFLSAALSGHLGGGPVLCSETTVVQSSAPLFPYTFVPVNNVGAIPYVWAAGPA